MASRLAVLPSVRALDLELTITDHDQIEWLNLGRMLPNLEAIHLTNFNCEKCDISLGDYSEYNIVKRFTAFHCFHKNVPRLHSDGFPLDRIVLDVFNYRTAEEMYRGNPVEVRLFNE